MYDARVARAVLLPALACACTALAACGGSSDRPLAERLPSPAPAVTLSARDKALWAPREPRRAAVAVLRYGRIAAAPFARQMALLDHAGYDTITLEQLGRFVRRRSVEMPARPLLLTFDGGRLETWTATDAALRRHGFGAVMFADVGAIERGDPAYLTYRELARLQAGDRWEVQLQSGTGDRRIRYGPAPGDVGSFYAYRGAEEVLGGWRERVFSDVTYGEDQLAHHVPGYRPLAFAPPYGNYGQAGTNDPRIPRLLLKRLELSFALVFTQDRPGLVAAGARNPLGRFVVGAATPEDELRARLLP